MLFTGVLLPVKEFKYFSMTPTVPSQDSPACVCATAALLSAVWRSADLHPSWHQTLGHALFYLQILFSHWLQQAGRDNLHESPLLDNGTELAMPCCAGAYSLKERTEQGILT